MRATLQVLIFGAMVLVSVAVHAENWSRFRGPNGQGVSPESDLPIRWSSTENVAWKTRIPGVSWSSPIVWGDSVFVTTATEEGVSCRVIRIDRKTGKS